MSLSSTINDVANLTEDELKQLCRVIEARMIELFKPIQTPSEVSVDDITNFLRTLDGKIFIRVEYNDIFKYQRHIVTVLKFRELRPALVAHAYELKYVENGTPVPESFLVSRAYPLEPMDVGVFTVSCLIGEYQHIISPGIILYPNDLRYDVLDSRLYELPPGTEWHTRVSQIVNYTDTVNAMLAAYANDATVLYHNHREVILNGEQNR